TTAATAITTRRIVHRMDHLLNAERYGSAAGAACNDVEARKTRTAAPVSVSRWFGGPPRLDLRLLEIRVTAPLTGSGEILPDLPRRRVDDVGVAGDAAHLVSAHLRASRDCRLGPGP